MKDRATEVAASKTVANLRSCSAQIVPAYIPTLSTIATKSPISRPTQKILGEMELEFGERDRGQRQLGEFIVVSEEFGFFRVSQRTGPMGWPSPTIEGDAFHITDFTQTVCAMTCVLLIGTVFDIRMPRHGATEDA
ncbi:uncharacterized protein LOC120106836 [Phoenix dactylifera]|uniref:Uncharacterized protein LOC120106836 n=1 Tax=Phoenix dactylifera TaxID=42345 RepID=A0A8B8ZR64_PHODC|nr:uncharacterized protein LOC120106836 [Phoenix dactylifera]